MAGKTQKAGSVIDSLLKNLTCDELQFRQLIARCVINLNTQVNELAAELQQTQIENESLKEALNEILRQKDLQ